MRNIQPCCCPSTANDQQSLIPYFFFFLGFSHLSLISSLEAVLRRVELGLVCHFQTTLTTVKARSSTVLTRVRACVSASPARFSIRTEPDQRSAATLARIPFHVLARRDRADSTPSDRPFVPCRRGRAIVQPRLSRLNPCLHNAPTPTQWSRHLPIITIQPPVVQGATELAAPGGS